MNHQIKQAKQQDIEQILKICSSNLYQNNKEQNIIFRNKKKRQRDSTYNLRIYHQKSRP